MKSLILVVFLCSWTPRAAFAAFDDLGAGARAPGMGDAVTAIADDVYATHYNPAGLGQLERMQVGLTHSKLYMGLSDGSDLSLSQLAFAKPISRGRYGTAGFRLDMFKLSGIYSENTFGFSYGKLTMSRPGTGKLFLGMNASYLQHSVTPGAEGEDALDDTFQASHKPDPVLSGGSKGAMDIDVGALFISANRFNLGLAIKHLMEPNVSFAGDSDKVSRKIDLGFAYRSLWMKTAANVTMSKAPDGSMDKDIVFAGERDFPTLDYGQFGVRGSLGVGSRSWRRFTMGASYRINKVQFDYAFQLPLGGIKQTMGTHRVGLTFHFGAPTPEEEYSSELLSQLKRMRSRAEGMGYDFSDLSRPADLSDPKLEPVMAFIREGKFREANRELLTLIDTLPPKPELFHLARRLDIVAAVYPEILDPKAKWEIKAGDGARAFLAGKDKEAAFLTSYAGSLNPQEYRIDKLSSKVVELTQVRVPTPMKGRNLLQELQARAEEGFRSGTYEEALTLSQDALIIEPDDAVSIQRVGTNAYMMGRYDDAIKAWKRALETVKDSEQRNALQIYIERAGNAKAGKLPAMSERPAQPAARAPAPSAPVEHTITALEHRPAAPKPQVEEKKAPKADALEIEKTFQAGLEFYARGDMVEALDKFRKVLTLDPGNVPARKAIERIGRGQR